MKTAPSPARAPIRSVRRSLLAAGLAAWAFTLAPAAGAESSATGPTGTTGPTGADSSFEDKTAVTLIEVPVNVADRNGQPVRGLKASDFEIFDNGKRQEIENMEVVDLATLAPTRAETQQVIETLPAVARRHFLLLFDLSFARPASLVKAREAARQFVLEHLHPTDLAAVATFSLEQGPQLLVTFTPDRAQLARAVETLGTPSLLRRGQVVDPLRFIIDAPDPGDLTDDGGLGSGTGIDVETAVAQHLSVIAFQRERARKAYERSRISNWSRAMEETAKALAAINGRKHVVYFSEGFDGSLLFGRDASRNSDAAAAEQRLREAGTLWLVDQDNTFGNSALQNDIADMLEEFRRADCLIQAVDIAGLRVETSVDGSGGNQVQGRLNDAQDALFYVADATGGNLFEDANDLGQQLENVLERNTVTYVLSFYPNELQFDGAYHRLKVKADLPRGTRLSHRSGYYAPRSFNDLHPMEKALLASQSIAAAAPRREIDVDLLAAPFRASPELAYVPVILEVEGRSLLSGHTGDVLNVEIYVYVTNARGEMRDFVTQIVSYDLRTLRSLMIGSGIKYYGHLDLVPDDYLLRVLVRNAETGKTAVASQNLTVPEYGEAQLEVLPPFFLEPPNRWFMVREESKGDNESVVYPFVVNGEPYIPSAKPEIRQGEGARFCLVAYNLGDGPLEIEAQVLDEQGPIELGGELSLLERTVTGIDGVDKLLASFDPLDLGAGEYTLEVAVRNVETGARQQSTIPIRIQ
ncbi:MAG: VWA domain-containing protein [Acidobacteriota bacterium]